MCVRIYEYLCAQETHKHGHIADDYDDDGYDADEPCAYLWIREYVKSRYIREGNMKHIYFHNCPIHKCAQYIYMHNTLVRNTRMHTYGAYL